MKLFKGNLEKSLYWEAYHIINADLFIQCKTRFGIKNILYEILLMIAKKNVEYVSL